MTGAAQSSMSASSFLPLRDSGAALVPREFIPPQKLPARAPPENLQDQDPGPELELDHHVEHPCSKAEDDSRCGEGDS